MKISQLLAIVVAGLVDPLLIHPLKDRATRDLLELPQMCLSLAQLPSNGSYLFPSLDDSDVGGVFLL